MKSCEEYEILISAYIDGELTEAEKAELMAHLADCENCRNIYNMYNDIFSAPLPEVPKELLTGVMDKIKAQDAPVQKKAKIHYLPRIIAAAACITVCLFAAFPALNGGTESFDAAVQENASGTSPSAPEDTNESYRGDSSAAKDDSLIPGDAAEPSFPMGDKFHAEESDSENKVCLDFSMYNSSVAQSHNVFNISGYLPSYIETEGAKALSGNAIAIYPDDEDTKKLIDDGYATIDEFNEENDTIIIYIP